MFGNTNFDFSGIVRIVAAISAFAFIVIAFVAPPV